MTRQNDGEIDRSLKMTGKLSSAGSLGVRWASKNDMGVAD